MLNFIDKSKQEKKMNLIFQLVKDLPRNEQVSIIQRLNFIGIKDTNAIDDLMKSNRMDKEHACVMCGCSHIVKNGKVRLYDTVYNKDGKPIIDENGKKKVEFQGEHQRYRCKDCGKTFVSTAKSVFYNSKLKPYQISQYLQNILRRDSVRWAAQDCDISVKTSFFWRHKILDTFAKMSNENILSGVIEADETGFPLSFKGNVMAHFKFYGMCFDEKKRFLRDNSRKALMGNNGQVSVCCGIDHNDEVIAVPTNLGKSTVRELEIAFDKRMEQHSILCSDKNASYVKFAKRRNLALLQFRSDDFTKKSGTFNIQSINCYHANLKMWMFFFRGVATKYLQNYLYWYNITKFSCKIVEMDELYSHLANTVSTARTVDIPKRPAIPFVYRGFNTYSKHEPLM